MISRAATGEFTQYFLVLGRLIQRGSLPQARFNCPEFPQPVLADNFFGHRRVARGSVRSAAALNAGSVRFSGRFYINRDHLVGENRGHREFDHSLRYLVFRLTSV